MEGEITYDTVKVGGKAWIVEQQEKEHMVNMYKLIQVQSLLMLRW